MRLQQKMQSEHGHHHFQRVVDVVVSNNDGMGMSMFNAWSKDNKVQHSDTMPAVMQ